ncbi:fimbria/pilus outer membrane usher protein [Pandoraea vervacti]|uniref:fimbria/pilus outer membrane usher protein n=1 Tax=Pandoraea vervacti TaxID=656178 RepID=UPI000A01CF0C|nr:fimbria/pilus outer membrane usher protein [Pandoraea vervacti]
MTIGKPGRCRWGLSVSIGVALAGAVAAGHGKPVDAAQSQVESIEVPGDVAVSAPGDEALYLEVVLNRVRVGRIVPVVLREGRLYVEAHTLHELGLALPDERVLVALDSLPGLRAYYDIADQRLDLSTSVDLLEGDAQLVGYQPPPAPRLDPATRAPGLLLNYDLYTQDDGQTRSLSGWSEVRLFGVGPGVFRSSNITQWTGARFAGDRFQSTRLDTSWQMDFPERMVSITLGDTYSGALAWTRTMRYGGIRISRNFNLQPYRVTVPLASFIGDTTVPSTVDLFINGIRESQSTVSPGRFQVLSAPVLNGAGSAQVVITDITGQSRVVNFSLYNSARLLQSGLSDWSIDLGKLRKNYGLNSFSYSDNVMASGSGRYGLNNHVTLEGHAESTNGLTMGGLGTLLLLGRTGGVVSLSYGMSRNGGMQGRQYSLGYEWQGQWLSANIATVRRDSAFRDVASLEGSTMPRRTDQAFLGVTIGRGQLGASYVRQDYPDTPKASYVALSWAQSLGSYGNINLSVSRDVSGGAGTTTFVYWSVPIGNRHHAWASAQSQRSGDALTVGAMRTLPGDTDGWGWRVQGSAGRSATSGAEISQLTRYGQWRAGAQYWTNAGESNTAAYAGATGGLLLMKGSLFPMRRVDDAFAMVSTDGIEGVPVKLENRLVGTTDDKGLLLVTPLNAWENNDLSIDPLVLPADVTVDRVRLAAVPATGSGMLARFPMKSLLVVELSLRDGHGEWVPPGTQVNILPGEQMAVTGYDGRLYLQDPPVGARIVVHGLCEVSLPADLPARGRINLGELACLQTK